MKSIQSRTIAAYVRGSGGSTIPGTDMALAGVESLAGSEAASGVLVSSQGGGDWFSGTWADGNQIVLSGSGFGAKSAAAPVLFDNVDNIAAYSGLSDGDAIPVGGSAPFATNSFFQPGAVKYETSDTMRHARTTAMYKALNTRNGALEGLNWTAGNRVYVGWWFRTDTDFSGSGHSSKLLRVSESGADTTQTFSWTQEQAYTYNGTTQDNGSGGSFDGNPGSWSFLEALFDLDSSWFTIRVDGVDLYTQQAFVEAFTFNRLWRIGFDGGGTSPPDITWWIDQIYVDRFFNRVMIGDSSVRANVTQWELQQPSAWADDEITITAHQGAHSSLSGRWVYVIDNDDAVVSGWPKQIQA